MNQEQTALNAQIQKVVKDTVCEYYSGSMTMRDYIEKHLRPIIPIQEYKEVFISDVIAEYDREAFFVDSNGVVAEHDEEKFDNILAKCAEKVAEVLCNDYYLIEVRSNITEYAGPFDKLHKLPEYAIYFNETEVSDVLNRIADKYPKCKVVAVPVVEKITDEMIDEAIKKAPKDRYGQTSTHEMMVHNLFPGIDKSLIEKHLETSPKYMLNTYGGQIGIFKAIARRK
jgi:hypothetical protein